MKASRTSYLRRTGISTEATSGLVPSEPGWWRFQPCRLEDFAELKKFYGNAAAEPRAVVFTVDQYQSLNCETPSNYAIERTAP